MTMMKLRTDFTTVTPCCWTSCGNCDSASFSLFCTCTCAMSGSTPELNVRTIDAEPALSLVEVM